MKKNNNGMSKIEIFKEPIKVVWSNTPEFLIATTHRNEIKIRKKDNSVILRNGVIIKGEKTLEKTKLLVEDLMK
jgi:hypothetical protein